MNTSRSTDETRVAEEIVSVLPAGMVARLCCEDRREIRYAVRGSDLKLRSIVLDRAALQRLGGDPARNVKTDYLRRDLLRSLQRRAEFRYPRTIRRAAAATAESVQNVVAAAR